jgi:hypothetical protein
MYFFKDYSTLRCNYEEFLIIQPYLTLDGWYFDITEITLDLALIQCPPITKIKRELIFYYNHELKYFFGPSKEVKEIIREIKLNELGIK